MKRYLLVAGVLILALWAAGSTPTPRGRYHGRVIDAESTQPIQGGVVVVVWLKTPLIYIDTVGHFHDAREALTDTNGVFSIDATPTRNWNPLKLVQSRPQIVVFKPGYGEYPSAFSRLTRPDKKPIAAVDEALHARQPVVLELPRLRSVAELRTFSDVNLYPRVPFARIPNYVRLLNEQRKAAGLEPYEPS